MIKKLFSNIYNQVALKIFGYSILANIVIFSSDLVLKKSNYLPKDLNLQNLFIISISTLLISLIVSFVYRLFLAVGPIYGDLTVKNLFFQCARWCVFIFFGLIPFSSNNSLDNFYSLFIWLIVGNVIVPFAVIAINLKRLVNEIYKANKWF